MHPLAFNIGPISIYWYGILTAIGFVLGFWTAGRRGLRDNISPDLISMLGPWLLVGAVVGARALHVISYWDEQFAGKPLIQIFDIRSGGLVYYGGFFGSCLATVIFSRVKKVPLWKIADIFAPSIPLGHAFGRIGCVMTGCCFGKECDLPWAIQFPKHHETHGQPVHPVQIYEAILNLLLYGFLAWLYRNKKRDGQVFAAYLIGYAILRSIVEVFRADYKPGERFLNGLITPGQFVSIGILAAGVILFAVLQRNKPRPT